LDVVSGRPLMKCCVLPYNHYSHSEAGRGWTNTDKAILEFLKHTSLANELCEFSCVC